MKRRLVVVPLWSLTGWMVGAMAAFVLDLPAWIALMTAVAVAAVVALDPAGWFWVRPEADWSGRSARHRPAVLSPLPKD